MTGPGAPAAPTPDDKLMAMLAEPYAFALLRWPAVLGLISGWDPGWGAWLPVLLGLWLLAMVLAAYGGGRGWAFGSLMLLLDGLIALAWRTYPSPWTLVWLLPVFIALAAAQRSRIVACPPLSLRGEFANVNSRLEPRPPRPPDPTD